MGRNQRNPLLAILAPCNLWSQGARARGQRAPETCEPRERKGSLPPPCSPLQVHCPGWELACAGAKSKVLAPWSRWFITKFLQGQTLRVICLAETAHLTLRGGSDSNLYSVTRVRLPWSHAPVRCWTCPGRGATSTPSDLISVPLGTLPPRPSREKDKLRRGSLSVVRQCLLRGSQVRHWLRCFSKERKQLNKMNNPLNWTGD